MNTLWQDIRFGARMMVKAPGFTLIAVMSIALGIALNAAVFTFVNGMLFKPMPVRDPERLVALYTTEPNSIYPGGFSYPDYVDYRDHNQVFSDLFIHFTTQGLSLKGREGAAEMVCGELVTGNYFTGLRLDASLGRLFTPEDDKRPGGHPVAVLSYAFWRRHFASDPNIVGRIVKLNGYDFTVIGVAKKGFSGTRRFGWIPDVYLPLMMYAQAIPGTDESFLSNRGDRRFDVNGRLRDGVTIEQARAAMNLFAKQLANDYPRTNANLAIGMIPAGAKVQPSEVILGVLSKMSGAMMGLVVFVLLVACANVANLLLARATARRREIAVRLALGASRRRLIRQLLTESMMLSMLGGALGLIMAVWLSDLFRFGAPNVDFDTVDFDYDLSLDYRVLVFTVAVSALTGIIFGLAPALQSSRPDLVPTLKGETTGAGRMRRRFNLRNLLVVAQVALSLMLLVSAGLLVKSMRNTQAMNPGFRTDHLMMASVNVGLQGYDEARGRRFYKQLGERLQSLPGVERASFAGPLPLDQYDYGANVTIEGRVPKTANERLKIGFSITGPDYFETMDTPIVEGRAFTDRDNENAPRVVIVNETMARRYWPNQNPIGKRMRLGGERSPWLEVAGVARDGKYYSPNEPQTDYFFLPFLQNYDGRMTLIARATGDPEGVIAGIRREVKALDEQLPVYGARNVSEFLDRVIGPSKAIAATVSGFGLLALLLAAVGLYGVMSYAVAERTREIGVRMALGAEPKDLKTMILRQGLRLSLGGAALGLAGAFGLSQLLRSLLYGVSATDPLIFGAVALSLMVVALVACWIPARRATKVDPMIALRCD
ncbi:MAG: ABC transporter permease [Blastocatellia bacterium]|nr:ABC transporter permease [Blastocatellia bacterium]